MGAIIAVFARIGLLAKSLWPIVKWVFSLGKLVKHVIRGIKFIVRLKRR